MKRRLAWFMAVLMCVTGVPQGTFLSMAAENNLTEAERELLESKRRGHALFMIGSKRLHVNFEIPDYKWAYFGKAGGR